MRAFFYFIDKELNVDGNEKRPFEIYGCGATDGDSDGING
jgi:hypothetical protein